MMGKYQTKLDTINVEIARLQKETNMEQAIQEVDNLRGIMGSLKLLRQTPNEEIVKLAEKIEKDIQALFLLVEEKEEKPALKLRKTEAD